ncbi:MAG: hypothetical protein EBX52_11640 [Proteobacteria bacterium]|nr:hypothetical protein [Pseudomonadota bacterium]
MRKEWENGLRSLKAGSKGSGSFFFEIQHEPLITVGGASFLSDALEAAGFRNVFRDLGSGYPKVSMESVVRARPDWIFVLGHEQGEEELLRSRKDWARFGPIPAVEKGRIVVLPGDDYARCSLRLLNALKQLKLRHGH